MSSSSISSLTEEVTELRQQFPKVQLQSATHDFLTASYQRTPYAHVKVTLTFGQEYPTKACLVSVQQQQGVPKGLAKKLETDLGTVAERHQGTHEQVVAVFAHLVTFVDTNMFVPCWKELRQIVDLQRPQKLDETKGYMKIRLVGGEYYYTCSITVDKGYPNTQSILDYGKPCQLTMDATNLPQSIEHLYTVQARNLVKRMQDGMSAEQALDYRNPIQAPTTDANVNANQKSNTSSTAHVRKEARQENHKSKSNCEKQQAGEKLERWQLQEQNRLQTYDIPEYDGSNPQPSLLSLVTFLHNMMDQLPQKTCACCFKTVMLSNPKDLAALFAKKPDKMTHAQLQSRKQARKLRPMRTSCGCWYHYTCLDTYMTAPPFGDSCPSCERPVFHPDWSGNRAELERAWGQTQARQREIQDAAMFF
jgi:hypothetical protein